jgi:hypothetical protein
VTPVFRPELAFALSATVAAVMMVRSALTKRALVVRRRACPSCGRQYHGRACPSCSGRL